MSRKETLLEVEATVDFFLVIIEQNYDLSKMLLSREKPGRKYLLYKKLMDFYHLLLSPDFCITYISRAFGILHLISASSP